MSTNQVLAEMPAEAASDAAVDPEAVVERLRRATKRWQQIDRTNDYLTLVRKGEVGRPLLEMIIRGEHNEPERSCLDTAFLAPEQLALLCDLWQESLAAEYYEQLAEMAQLAALIPQLAAQAAASS